MVSRLALAGLTALVVLLPAALRAQDAQEILDRVQAKEAERLQGIHSYLVDQSTMGTRTQVVYDRFDVRDEGGATRAVFLPLTLAEFRQRHSNDTQNRTYTAEELETMASGYEMAGDAMSGEVEKGMREAGLPPGLLDAGGSDPWLSMNPGTMMGGMGGMLRDMAASQRADTRSPEAEARSSAADAAGFAARASLVGTETIDGRTAHVLRADGLRQVQSAEGQEYRLDTATVWIDAEEYVTLKTRMEGVATAAGGETRPFVIERRDTDYRTVPGSRLYQSHRQVMSMEGMVDEKDRAEMEKAGRQMAEMEAQLAQMPEAQRQMVMRQMRPQMDMMRSLSDGRFEVVTEVHEIRTNPDPDGLPAAAAAPVGGAPAVGALLTSPPPAAGAGSEDALERARQACLEDKIAAAEAKQKTKRGLGRLASAVTRTASRMGLDLGGVTRDIYDANATAEDLSAAARELGLAEEDIAECRDPR